MTYREHVVGRPRTSLDRVLGNDRPSNREELLELRRAVFRERGFISFTEDELERMPSFAKAAIGSEARRILGRLW